MRKKHGIISQVQPHSIGAELGLRPGDAVFAINGHPLRDVIDYRFYSAEEELELLVRQGGEEILYEIERDWDEPLGLEFTAPTFDGMRVCNNNCVFCFVKQMPPKLRATLYLKDDDYRYSFLYGNFVTLTNLRDDDWARIEEQHLSPLYVSVHATETALRRQLLGNPRAPDILLQLRRLKAANIEIHTQIVLMPGLNDGAHLERTVCDLRALEVDSIAIVPVGLTRFHSGDLRTFTAPEARGVLAQVTAWQFSRLYLSDEWYLLAGAQFPPASAYDDFPQIENGVGLVRTMLDEFRKWRGSHDIISASSPKTLVCGTLIAPLLRELLADWENITILPITNHFFGATVTVSGLLTGRDVIAALQHQDAAQTVFLPRAMLDAAGRVTLDDMTVAEIARAIGKTIQVAESIANDDLLCG